MKIHYLIGLFVATTVGTLHAEVVTLKNAPEYEIFDGKGKVSLLLNEATGSKEAAVDFMTLNPGTIVPEHLHETSVEILHILSGSVKMTVSGVVSVLHPGDTIRIPANTKHSASVEGKVAATALQVYIGPGPEQRFTKGKKLH